MDQFINDVKSGRITELKLIKTTTDVIRENRYGKIFNVWRHIANVTDKGFDLMTESSSGDIVPCEAYFNAFTYVKGNTVGNNNSEYIWR